MRVGIVGAGHIVPPFLKAAKMIEGIDIKAICAKNSPERLQELKAEFNIPNVFDDYDEMLLNKDVDTIYVAVPNHIHHEMAKKALEKGLNVILEKPFTVTLSEAEELFDIAQKNSCYIFEGITTLHSPNFHKAKEMVKEMEVIKIVYLNYTQYSGRYDAFKNGEVLPAFDYKKAGGALRDINIYNIHFAVGIFGMPNKVQYYPNIERNIDVSGILILEYDNFVCSLIGSKDCTSNAEIRIQGNKQTLYSKYPANVFANFEFHIDKEKKEYDFRETNEHMFYELHEFERVIIEDDAVAMDTYKNHTLNVMKVVEDAINSQVKIKIAD